MKNKRVVKLGDGSWAEHYQQWHNDPAGVIADIKNHSNLQSQNNITVGWYGLDLSSPGTRSSQVENEWPEFIRLIKTNIEKLLGVNFNSCQVNRYVSSFVAVNWHTDLEQISDKEPTVAILSLGAYREMLFRPAPKGQPAELSSTYAALKIDSRTVSVPMASGDLLVLRGLCQHRFEHALKQSTDANPRYSLVFRKYGV